MSQNELKRLFTDPEKNCIRSLKNRESFAESAVRDFMPGSFNRLHKTVCDQLSLISERKRKTTGRFESLKASLHDLDIQNKMVEAKMSDKSTDDAITDCLSGFDQPCREFEAEVAAFVADLNHLEELVDQLDHCWSANASGEFKLAEELLPRMASCASLIRYACDRLSIGTTSMQQCRLKVRQESSRIVSWTLFRGIKAQDQAMMGGVQRLLLHVTILH